MNKRNRNLLWILCLMICLALAAPGMAAPALMQVQDDYMEPARLAREKTGEMTAEDAIAIAQDGFFANVGLDYGVQGFRDSQATQEERLWGGAWRPFWAVKFDVVSGDMLVPAEVLVAPDEKRAVSVTGRLLSGWEDEGYGVKAPENLGRPAWIKNPNGGPVAMAMLPDDYGVATQQLYPGTPVTLNHEAFTLGNYPHEIFNDPLGKWAHITVGKTADSQGASGFVPLVCLAFEAPADKPLTGSLSAPEGEDEVSLLQNTGLTQDKASAFPAGSQARVLGRTKAYYQVAVGGSMGFVPLDALSFDDKTAAQLESMLPERFDDIQPGWEARFWEYQSQRTRLYNKYGPLEGWTLEQLAQGSALALSYGFTWVTGDGGQHLCFVLPGPDDLSLEEARERGLKLLAEKYQYPQSAVKRVTERLFFYEGAPETRLWRIALSMDSPQRSCMVTLNQEGEAVAFWQADKASPPEPQAQASPLPRESLHDYLGASTAIKKLPKDPALPREDAEQTARALLEKAWPEVKGRSFAAEISYWEDELTREAWWLVSLKDQDQDAYPLPFEAVILLPDGAKAFYDENYAEYIQTEQRNRALQETEKTKGYFVTWTLEDKAAWDPNFWGLPREGDLSPQKAEEIARAHLNATEPEFRQHPDGWQAYFFYQLNYGDRHVWRVDFLTEQMLQDGIVEGFAVQMDAATGEVLESWTPHGNG